MELTTEEICAWVRKYQPEYDDAECIEAFMIYRAYRSEGQSHDVSRQYAGLM